MITRNCSSFLKTRFFPVTLMLFLFTGFLFARGSSPSVPASPIVIDSSITSGNWSNPSTWSTGSVPTHNTEVVITSGTTVLLDTHGYCGSIVISSSAIFNESENTLSVSGNFTNNGTVLPGSSTVVFDGTTLQTLSGSTATTSFSNLTDSNATSELSVMSNVNVGSNLTVALNAVIHPSSTALFNSSESQGFFQGPGTVLVTKTSSPATFTSQYHFTIYNLTNTIVNYAGDADQQIDTQTYWYLIISNTAGIVSAPGNFYVKDRFTIEAGATFVPASTTLINTQSTSGEITGEGTIKVTNASTKPADLDNQYQFVTYTLSDLTVEYTAIGQTLSDHTYGNLTISGSILGSGSATVGKTFLVTDKGTYQPTDGMLVFIDNSSFSYTGSGSGINFQDVFIDSGATVTTSSDFKVYSTFTVDTSGSFVASGGTADFMGTTGNDDIFNSGTLVFNNFSVDGTDVSTSSSFSVNGTFSVVQNASTFYTYEPSYVTMNGPLINGNGALEFSYLLLGADVTSDLSFDLYDTLALGSHNLTVDYPYIFTLDIGDDIPAIITGSGDVLGTTLRPIDPGIVSVPIQFSNAFSTLTFHSTNTINTITVGTYLGVPTADSSAVARFYDISAMYVSSPSSAVHQDKPEATVGYLADLQLHYNDNELNGNHEGHLYLESAEEGGFTKMGASSFDTVNNFVVLDSVSHLSLWTLSDGGFGAPAKRITVSGISANDKEYDRTTLATLNTGDAVLNGITEGDDVSLVVTGAVGTFDTKDAGFGKTVFISGLTLTGLDIAKYILDQPTTTANISPKHITVSVTIEDKMYDGGRTGIISGATFIGKFAGDSLRLGSGTAIFADKNVGTGISVDVTGVSLSGPDQNNYLIDTSATATGNITRAPLTVTGITAFDKVYDANVSAVIYVQGASLQVIFGEDNVLLNTEGATGVFINKFADTGKTVFISGLTISGNDANNYSLSQPTTKATISRKPLTGSFTAGDKPYDGNTSATILTRTLDGVIGSVGGNGALDDVTYTGGTATFDTKNIGAGKTVTAVGLTLSGNDKNNYSVNDTATTTASIIAKVLTGSITVSDKIYDATRSATIQNRSLSGVVGEEDVKYIGGTAIFDTKNVGLGKTVMAFGLSLSGSDKGNYTVNDTAYTTATVTPYALVGSVTASDKVYDGSTNATIVDRSLTGVLGGVGGNGTKDDVSYVGGTATFDTKNAGNGKTVTAIGLTLDGVDKNNYTVNDTAVTSASITKKPITGTITADNKVYDGSMDATIHSRSLTGKLESDSVTYVGGTALFDTRWVGTDKTVTGTGLSLSGVDANNYSVNDTATTTAAITAKPLIDSVTVSDKVYDGTTTATITDQRLIGVITENDVNFEGGTAQFLTKSAGTGKVVLITGLSLTGEDANNYSLSDTAITTATISKKPVTGFISASDKVYDGTRNATITGRTLNSDQVISGDSIHYVGGTGMFDTKHIGTEKTVTAVGLFLSGADSANYSVNDTATTSAAITPKPLTGSITAANKIYDGTTDATITSRTVTGEFSGDSVTYTGGTATFDTKYSGTNKTVTAIGLSLSGPSQGDYTVNDTATTTATILPEAYTIATGVWHNASIWQAGVVPIPGNPTRISTGTAVTLDTNVTCDTILIVDGTLITGPFVVGGAGNFLMEAGSTLEIGSPDGISYYGAIGSIQSEGNREFNQNANYVYNGTSEQITGNALPYSVNSLIVNNSFGVTLSNGLIVQDSLNLSSGDFILKFPQLQPPTNKNKKISGLSYGLDINGMILRANGDIRVEDTVNVIVGGSGNQLDIPLGTFYADSLWNLIIDRATGASLSTNVIVGGWLTLFTGNLYINNKTITLYEPIQDSIVNFKTNGLSRVNIFGSAFGMNLPPIDSIKTLTVNDGYGLTLLSNFVVVDTLDLINGIVSNQGYTITAFGNVINYSGYDNGKLVFRNGSARHSITTIESAEFYDLELNDSLGVQLHGSMTVIDTLTILKGLVRTGTDTVVIGGGGELVETPGNLVYGYVKTDRFFGEGTPDFANIGIRFVFVDSYFGDIEILRVNDSVITKDGSTTSIERYFRVSEVSELRAGKGSKIQTAMSIDSVIFQYDESERGSHPVSTLHLFQLPFDSTTWELNGTDTTLTRTLIKKSSPSAWGFWTAFNYVPIIYRARVQLSDTSLAFDTLVLGESDSAAFTVKNVGNTGLNVYSVSALSGDVVIQSPTSVLNIAPDSTATFHVKYIPTFAQSSISRIVLAVNDSIAGPLDSIRVRLLAFERKHPGDANNDNKVLISDIIDVGVHYLLTGSHEPPVRSDGVHLLPITGWPSDAAARADCNGDGTIDTGDVRVIADTLHAYIANSGGEVYKQMLAMAQALPEGKFRNDFIAFIATYKQFEEGIPKTWSLMQNYPNPFNGATIIRYGVPVQAQTVRLVIYDILGRAVRIYEQHDLKQGWYEVSWDGIDQNGVTVATGLYFYRLELPVASPAKKLLYVR